MSRQTKRRPETERADIYQEITDTIIAELEAGCPPWVRPWSASTVPLALPRNATTERRYSGINIMLLWRASVRNDFRSPYWLTFRQALEAGGNVRKGERGTSAVFANRFTPDAEKQRASDAGDEVKSISFLKRFTVFNAEQCDGLDPRLMPDIEPDLAPQGQLITAAEELIAASGVVFVAGAADAFYVAADDAIRLPSWQRFEDPLDRQRICLHELIHATGHPSRLDRDLTSPFGSPGYAREELIAELGAAFICASLGIPPTVRHASYIASWLEVLRDDKRAIFKAASAASKAAHWLLDRRDVQGGADAEGGATDTVPNLLEQQVAA